MLFELVQLFRDGFDRFIVTRFFSSNFILGNGVVRDFE